jgi:hypothetical protein
MPESSPDTELEVQAQVTETTAETGAKGSSTESPTAEKTGQQGDVLSAVKAALEPDQEGSPDSANLGTEKKSPETAAKDGAEGDDDSEDFTEEEKARLSRKAKSRFHKLTGEVGDLKTKVADIEPKAQRFEQLVQFCNDAGLNADEVNRTFDVARAIKQDPLKAFEMLTPVYEQLRQLVGEVLPDDLQQAVNVGQITEAHARELARSRSAATLREQQLQRVEQRQNVERQRKDVTDKWQSAANATTEWENSKAKSDPDWKLKQPRVIELIELDLLKRQQKNQNFTPTIEEAITMANAALAKVNEEMKRLRPAPKAMNPITEVGSTRSEAKPKSALEAAKAGLAAMAG